MKRSNECNIHNACEDTEIMEHRNHLKKQNNALQYRFFYLKLVILLDMMHKFLKTKHYVNKKVITNPNAIFQGHDVDICY